MKFTHLLSLLTLSPILWNITRPYRASETDDDYRDVDEKEGGGGRLGGRVKRRENFMIIRQSSLYGVYIKSDEAQ